MIYETNSVSKADKQNICMNIPVLILYTLKNILLK